MTVKRYQRTLCRLAIGQEELIEEALAGEDANREASRLDRKTHALVRLAALVALDAASPSYLWPIQAARDAGATESEIVGCLVAVMPALGAARVVSAAPKLGLALGYDVAAALEEPGTRLV